MRPRQHAPGRGAGSLRRWVVVASLAGGFALATSAPANASRPLTLPRGFGAPHSVPMRAAGARVVPAGADQQSTNWSGVADTSSKSHFTSVAATWQVPAVQRAPGARAVDTYSSTWVGIGGDVGNDNTLIQAGTEQDVSSSGFASYGAWYEMLPAASVAINKPVAAGDTVSVSIVETNAFTQSWTISVADTTQNWTFSQVFKYKSSTSSAEWIEEAPTVGFTQSTMADFQSVTFSQVQVDGQSTLAPSGVTASRIDYVNGSNTVLAYPEGYDVAHNSFAITYGTPHALALAILPDARQGTPYTATVSGTGGLSPYTVDVTGGLSSLPQGLSFDPSTDAITGTPTATANVQLDVTVQDDAGSSISGVVPLDALGPTFTLTQGFPSVERVTAGSALRGQLALTPAQPLSLTGPVRYVTTSPSRFVLVGATGTVTTASSTPIGTYTASGTDSDPNGDAGTWSITVDVVHPSKIVVVTRSLPSATVGVAYATQLLAFGPVGSPSWAVLKGHALPAGLALSSAGTLHGKPGVAAKGLWSLRLVVTDHGLSRAVTFSLRVR